MDPKLEIEKLAELVCLLTAESDPRVQERLLVEDLWTRGWAQAVALYRQPEGSEGWIEVLARGPVDLLPTTNQVRAVAKAELSASLPLGKRVLFAKDVGGPVALGLGGFAGDDGDEAQLEALIDVFSLVMGSIAQTGGDLLDLLQAPWPSDEGPL